MKVSTAKQDLLTHDFVKSVLQYDPETGEFRWIVNRGKIKAGAVAGCTGPDGYWVICLKKAQFRAHRLAFFYMTGRWPAEIDHINMVRDDNRWSNLREVTRSFNLARRPTQSRLNAKGVSKQKNRFYAEVWNGERKLYLGSFPLSTLHQRLRKILTRRYKRSEPFRTPNSRSRPQYRSS